MERFDAAIIGGGPAGSVCAGFLAQAGLRVVLFEKERFPRYHIGESLLSATMPILEALGVMPEVEAAGFVRKPGGTFIWGSDAEPWNFYFREDPGGRPHAFHVLRSQFDHILLKHAAALGADVREAHQVREVAYDGGVNRIAARDENGVAVEVETPWLVDASGQSAFLGRRDDLRQFDPFFKNLAVFGYYEGAEPLAGPVAGNIMSAAFGDGWFWYIPLHDGTTSVGAVVDAQTFAGEAGRDPLPLYLRLVEACAAVAERVRDARLVSPIRVIRDYSYDSRSFHGPGYLLAGDAACFIDPVFSTGVHLASLAGYLAARTVTGLLEGGEREGLLADYDARYRAAFERYRKFLYFFYDHHCDRDSYFWTARKVLNAEASLDARTAFVRLLSGGGDILGEEGALKRELAERHARFSDGTKRGRFASTPDASLFRVRRTLSDMEE